jgi:hypothetical protein
MSDGCCCKYFVNVDRIYNIRRVELSKELKSFVVSVFDRPDNFYIELTDEMFGIKTIISLDTLIDMGFKVCLVEGD